MNKCRRLILSKLVIKLSNLEDLLDRFPEAVKVIVNQALLVQVIFSENADQGEKAVHLSQV